MGVMGTRRPQSPKRTLSLSRLKKTEIPATVPGMWECWECISTYTRGRHTPLPTFPREKLEFKKTTWVVGALGTESAHLGAHRASHYSKWTSKETKLQNLLWKQLWWFHWVWFGTGSLYVVLDVTSRKIIPSRQARHQGIRCLAPLQLLCIPTSPPG